MHDPRWIPKGANLTEGRMQLQCLNCGSVFRADDFDYASTLISCEVEKKARAEGNVACMPMMVSTDSEKYDG